MNKRAKSLALLLYNIYRVMKSQLAKEHLKTCAYADLSKYNEATGTFIIPKYSKPSYSIGKMYLVEVSPNIVNNTNSVVATNWNNGTAPKTAYLKIYVSNIVGKMIKVDSIAVDENTKQDLGFIWSGYLPINELTQILKL